MAKEDLTGKSVVITGASSGFGKGAARKFAEAGASLVLAARRDELLNDLVQECEARGVRAVAVPTDVAHQDQVEQLANAALTAFGAIDIWVNNAGAAAIGRFDEVPLADHVRVIETDLLGTLYGSYFAMRQFRKQGAGTLINVASLNGKIPSPYFSSYAAAKHGVVGLGTSLRQELQQDKIDTIRVCTIMPTTFDTPFFEHAARYTGKESVPVSSPYDPKDVVDTIVQVAANPQDEVIVGTSAHFINVAHHLFPGLIESIVARQAHKTEIEKAPPGKESSGSLHEPMATGTDVRGGWKK